MRSDAPFQLDLPRACVEKAPDHPTAFCDGSLKQPRFQEWGLGGFGEWWPARRLEEKPLSRNEKEYCHARQEDDGLSLWGATAGQKTSSTRIELTTAILAAHQGGPQHILSDSMSFVRKANRIINGENLTRKKPWAIQKK